MGMSNEEIDALAKRLSGLIAAGVDERIEAKVRQMNALKWERMAGVDCEDAEARADTRKDFEHIRKLRLRNESEEGQADFEYLRKRRLRGESEEGQAEEAAVHRLASMLRKTEAAAASYLAKLLAVGLFALAILGMLSGDAIKAWLKDLGHTIAR
jgi:hypothetical protein